MFSLKTQIIKGGANKISLNEARKNFLIFGAAKEKAIKYVRKPYAQEIPLEKTKTSYRNLD